ncbi:MULTISPECIES: META domain-containing protein [unclassified Nostoc]|uniref:META domain-containing protein n=1 Tax=unclassified Nostoc TaxID=2593658 RepID=UPI002AD52DC8|nr:META domain-containing protein [Nostoc sp. DedQUE03]MDZ7971489.1 META domain-containing protein [Nostoc sp. DedQUE03]MDZ8046483.1 META domain-containing protein [Nostoc sp. DedQUE02]
MQTKMVSLKVILIQVSFVLSIVGVALTFSLALLACTKSSSTQLPTMSSERPPQSRVALKNSSWRLERWERKGSAVALAPQTELSLHFDDNQVNGFGGCNRFGGSFKLADDQLSLGTLDATQKGCDPVVMNQEVQFLSALQSVRRIGSDASGSLVLFYAMNADEGVLYFAPMK